MSQERAATSILGIFGPLALILAAIGLYGIVNYSVTIRAHEFGIRLALGAKRNDIRKLVVREGMIATILGLAVGLPASMIPAKLVASWLYGISPFDPITYILVSILCLAAAFVAAIMPSRKACIYPCNLLRNVR